MKTVKILIADDHAIIHNGIRDILKDIKRYKIIGNAMDGNEAVEKAISLNPDIILMDISMPELNGIEATNIIKLKLPDVKILALTQHEENEYVMQMLNSGGMGYLLKNSPKEEFIDAIETTLTGKKYLSEKISDQLINDFIHQKSGKQNSGQKEIQLTNREKEIIQKIADDKSNQLIADELHISLRTVETHRRNLMQKLKVTTVVGLLKYASRHKLISFH